MTSDLDRQRLLDHVQELIRLLRPLVDKCSVLNWDGTDGFLPIVRRSALRRQFESLETTLQLVQAERADGAVGLLRPACEELLWLRYLNRLSETDGRELIDCMLHIGLLRDLEAQAGEVGESTMVEMGLAAHLKRFQWTGGAITDRLKALGKKLKWPSQAVRKGEVPSTWFIAKETASEDLYRFLYHATSRYVHFSVVELARRGWGRPGRLELSARHYEPIWAFFCLCWGARVMAMMLKESASLHEGAEAADEDSVLLQRAFNKVLSVQLIPIITPDELIWDPTPQGRPA